MGYGHRPLSVEKDDNGNGYSPVVNAALKFKPLEYWFVETNIFGYIRNSQEEFPL